jgi:hypothetical protein
MGDRIVGMIMTRILQNKYILNNHLTLVDLIGEVWDSCRTVALWFYI